MKMHECMGFSLIELMIVVAIIGVLTVIALPTYQQYTSKAKFTEVVQAVSPFKLAVESCWHEQGDMRLCINGANGVAQNGLPPAIQNSGNANTFVKTVRVDARGNDSVKIIATSQHIGKSNQEYTYVLDGTTQEYGQLLWSKDLQSTCLAAGIC